MRAVVGDDDGGDAGGAGVDGQDAHRRRCRRRRGRCRGSAGRSRTGRAPPASRSSRCRPRPGSRGRPAPAAKRLELGLELGGDRHLLLLGGGGQVEVVEVEQPGQLGDRLGVVVDAQVDRDVVEAAVPGALLDHQQRRRLPAARVAAGRVAGGQRVEQPAGERRVRVGGLPGRLHGLDDVLAGEDVALDGVAVAGEAAGPVEAGVPGVRGGAAVDVDDADLAVVAALVVLEQPLQRDRGGRAVVEVGERLALVGDVGVGLGGDRADAGHRGRYGGADGEELGGHGHPPRLSVGGPGHDRERHGRDPSDDRSGLCAPRPEAGLDVRGELDRVLPAARLPVASAATAGSSPRSRSTRSAAACSCRSRCSTSWSPPTCSLVQVGAAISLALGLVALPGRPADRLGWSTGSAPSRCCSPATCCRASASWPTCSPTRSSRSTALDGRGRGRPHRVLGLLRQHRRGDLACRGSGRSGSASSARCATSASRVGGLVVRPRDHDRHARRRTPRWCSPTRCRTPSRSCCCSPCRPTERSEHQRAGRARGRRCCATGPTGCCGCAQFAYSIVDDGAELRDAGLRDHRARAARLGDRRGVHDQHGDGRLRPGAGGARR